MVSISITDFIIVYSACLSTSKCNDVFIHEQGLILLTSIGTRTARSISVIQCGYQCFIADNCCVATYNRNTTECTLDIRGCCYPQTRTSEDHIFTSQIMYRGSVCYFYYYLFPTNILFN